VAEKAGMVLVRDDLVDEHGLSHVWARDRPA
jgi:hypothetical protein